MTEVAASEEQRLGSLLSRRVAHLRHRDGLSLDGLAERSGLSKGTVVAIEKGAANPSIAVLCRLAAAFSISVSDLIEEAGDGVSRTPIERTMRRTLWQSERGGAAVMEAAISGSTMFELWSWTLAPGDYHMSEAHRPGTTELIAVRAGTLEVAVGGEVVRLEAGETARLRTDQPHSYATIGPHPVTFTMAVLEKGSPTQLEE